MIKRYKYSVAALAIIAASASFAQNMSSGTMPSAPVSPVTNGTMGSAPVNDGYSGSATTTGTSIQGNSISSPATVEPAASGYNNSGYSNAPSTSGASTAGSSMTGNTTSSNGYENTAGYGSGAASRAYVESSPLLNPNNPHVAPQIGAQNFNLYSGGN